MNKMIKVAVVSSLLVAACFMIFACGGDTENFVQGNGQIDVTVTHSVTGLALPGVQVQVRKVSATDPNIVDSATTDASGKATFQETIGTDYYFTFSAPGFVNQTYVNNPVKPALTVTQTVIVAMVPVL